MELDDAIIWDNLGIAYKEKGQLKKARKAYKKAHDLAPDDAQIKEHLSTL